MRNVTFEKAHPLSFERVLERVRIDNDRIREATSEFSHVEGTRYFLTMFGDAGYAIRPDGELVFVFSTVAGRGDTIVAQAVGNGADRLDCFDGYLPKLYARHGFVEYDRDNNWTPGGPDVVYMRVPHVATFDPAIKDFWCSKCGTVSDFCEGIPA